MPIALTLVAVVSTVAAMSWRWWFALALVLGGTPAVIDARDYMMVKIADDSDIPGGFEPAPGFPPDMNSGGEVSFWALGSAWVGNGLVLDLRMSPFSVDPASVFLNVGIPAIDDAGTIAFYAGFAEPLQSMIGAEAIVTVNRARSYSVIAGQAIRDPAQPFEGRFGQLPDITPNGTVFLTGVLPTGDDAIGHGIGGAPAVLVAAATSDLAYIVQGDHPCGNVSGDVAFRGALDSGEQAVLVSHGPTLLVFARTTTAVYSPPSMNDARAVAFADLTPAPTGGYAGRLVTTQDGVGYRVIVDSSRDGLVPNFLYPPSINADGDVLFLAEDHGRTNLYVGDGDTIEPVVALPNGIFDGPIGYVAIGPRAMNASGQIAFTAGALGVWRADPVGGSGGGAGCGSRAGVCEDDDPCTVDTGVSGTCAHDPVVDSGDAVRESAGCADAPVPGSVGRRYLAACRAIGRAKDAPTAKKARRLFGKATRSLVGAGSATTKAGGRRKRPVSAECTLALTCTIDTAKGYVDRLRSAL
jgi:hypothetical protein